MSTSSARYPPLSLPPSYSHSLCLCLCFCLWLCVCVRKNYDSGSRAPGQPVSGNTYTQSVQSKANEREIEECEKGCARQPAEAPKWQNKRAYFMLPFYLPIPIPISTSTFILIQSRFLFHSLRNMMTSLLATLLCMFFDTFWMNMQEQFAKV